MNYKGFVPENNVIHLHNTPILQTLHSIYQQKSFLYDICGKLVENTSLTPVEYSTKMKVFHKILLYVDQHYRCTDEVARLELSDFPWDMHHLVSGSALKPKSPSSEAESRPAHLACVCPVFLLMAHRGPPKVTA